MTTEARVIPFPESEGDAIARDNDRENRYFRDHADDDGSYQCQKTGHRFGCPCRAGGEPELLPGWAVMEIDGDTYEVQVDA